jgi:hypothetical protein
MDDEEPECRIMTSEGWIVAVLKMGWVGTCGRYAQLPTSTLYISQRGGFPTSIAWIWG